MWVTKTTCISKYTKRTHRLATHPKLKFTVMIKRRRRRCYNTIYWFTFGAYLYAAHSISLSISVLLLQSVYSYILSNAHINRPSFIENVCIHTTYRRYRRTLNLLRRDSPKKFLRIFHQSIGKKIQKENSVCCILRCMIKGDWCVVVYTFLCVARFVFFCTNMRQEKALLYINEGWKMHPSIELRTISAI